MATHTMNFQGAEITCPKLTTTSNVEVGGDLPVTGNLTVGGNATMSSNLEIGTANLFVDTTTSNVGIGTNATAG